MTDSQKWLWFAGAGVAIWVFYLLSPIFAPFLISLLLAYLGDPLVDRLENWKLSRTVAVFVVFLFMLLFFVLVVILLVPMIERQVSQLIANMPKYLKWLQEVAFPWISARFGITDVQFEMDSLKQVISEHWTKAGGVVATIVKSVSTSGLAIIGWLSTFVLVPVVTFYLLRDWDVLIKRLHVLVPRRMEKSVVAIARDSDEVLGSFLRGQLLVMLVLGGVYSIGLWIIGLKLWLLIGMISGLVSFVPYLGFIVGVVAAGFAMLLQTQEVAQLIPVLIVFGVGQLLEGFLLTPLLVGDKIGLHPVAVIFAVLAGGQLFGFVGILIALPVAAVIAVLLRHAHERYMNSQLYDQANQ